MDPLLLFIIVANLIAAFFFVGSILKKPQGSRGWGSWSSSMKLTGVAIAMFVLGGIPFVFPMSMDFGFNIVFSSLLLLSVILYVFVFATLIADMAARKGRSWVAFFCLSIIFSPLIMWIIAASISPQLDSPSSGKNQRDSSEELRKLSELHKDGILSDSEFESKKKELLDRI